MSWTLDASGGAKGEIIEMEEHYEEEEVPVGHIEYIIEDGIAETELPEDKIIPAAKSPVPKQKHRRITAEEQERMLQLKGEGKTVIQIATEMGIRRTTVHEVRYNYIFCRLLMLILILVIRLYQFIILLQVLKRTNDLVTTNILKLRRMQQQKRKRKNSKLKRKQELLTDEMVDQVHQWLDEDSRLSMSTLVKRLRDIYDVTISQSYLSKVIDDFTYSLSRLSVDPMAQIKQDAKLIAARQEYGANLLSLHSELAEEDFVFVHFAEFTLVVRTNATGEVPNERGMKRSIYNAIGCALNRDKVLLYSFNCLALEPTDYLEFFAKLIERMQQEGMKRGAVILNEEYLADLKDEVLEMIRKAGFRDLVIPRESVFVNPVERLFTNWKSVTNRANAKDEGTLTKAMETASETLITIQDLQLCFTSFLSTMIHCYHGKWYDTETNLYSFGCIRE